MAWSATAFGGAVATIIIILATLAEFSYIPTTLNNTSQLTCRLIYLFLTLSLTAGLTFYIAIVEQNVMSGSLALIHLPQFSSPSYHQVPCSVIVSRARLESTLLARRSLPVMEYHLGHYSVLRTHLR